MMKKLSMLCISYLAMITLISCSPVKLPIKNQYQLTAYTSQKLAKKPMPITLLITLPDVASAYQTSQMFYIKKPYELQAFAQNAWVNPPAEMLYPLIIQSFQQTNVFAAITSNSYTVGSDYRLDNQLIALEQNFLNKPSVIEFSIKMVLTHINDNKVLGSRIIKLRIPCPMDTPYGGVIAANKATQQFTAHLTHFVVSKIKAYAHSTQSIQA